MDATISSFYQALFGGALTFYGIAAAVIIAAFQIVQSNLNFRVNWFKLLGKRNVNLIIIVTVVNIILIGSAAVATSFKHDLIGGNQHSYRLFGSLWYVLLILVSTTWLIYIAIDCTRKILSSLLPSNLIQDLMPSVASPEAITNYVLYRYATEPRKPFVFDIMHFASKAEKKKAKPAKTLKPDEAKKLMDKLVEGDPKRLKEELGKYQQVKKAGRKSDDPLVPLTSIMRKAVRENDTQTLAQAHDQLIELLLRCKVDDEEDIGVAESLRSQTNGCVINYYADIMTSIFDMSISAEAFNCSREIVRLTFDAAEQFKVMQNWLSKSLIYNFWEYAGTTAVRKDLAAVFISVVQRLSEMTITQIRTGEKEDDALSKLTRLIEKRFMHAPPEEEPILDDRGATSDYAEIMNSLANIGSAYDEQAEKASPHLYFVAVSFVSKHLIQNYLDEEGSDERLEQTVIGFMIDHVSFAREAAFKGNADGLYVAYVEFKLFDWRLEDDNPLLNPFKSYLLTGLIDLADLAIKHRGKLGTSDNFRSHEWFVDEVLKTLADLHSKWPDIKPEQRTITDLIVKSHDGEAGSSQIITDFSRKVKLILPDAD